jgi:hypothetical protein
MAGPSITRPSRLRSLVLASVVGACVLLVPGIGAAGAATAPKNADPVGTLVQQVEADAVCDVGWLVWDVDASTGVPTPSPFCVPVPAQLAGFTL